MMTPCLSVVRRALIAPLALAAGHAGAALVVHDNSALAFTWTRGTIPTTPNIFWGRVLDPTLPASAQTGAAVDHGFGWLAYEPTTSLQHISESIVGYYESPNPQNGHVALSPDFVWVGPINVHPAKVFTTGQNVTAGNNWVQSAPMGWAEGFQVGKGWFLGQMAHVGIRFELPTGTHYGWIRLELMPGIGQEGHYQPTAWAYETISGAPALVPAPATILLLAGLLTVAPRRRG